MHFLDTVKGVLRSVPTASPYASYIHDFMITREHAVALMSPATMSQERVARGGGLFAWEPDLGTHLVIVPRDPAAGEPVIIELDDNTYCLHPQNAYLDAAGRIILDGPQFPVAPVPCDNLDPWKQFNGLKSFMERWEIDVTRRTVKRTRIDERNVELPQCDRRYQGLEYRYGYNLCSVGDINDYAYDGILAYDMRTGAAGIHHFKNGDTACEPLFAPRRGDSPEGDGYLMTLVYRSDQDRSDFVILDAKNVSDEPVPTVALPHRVPFSAHGCWVADLVA